MSAISAMSATTAGQEQRPFRILRLASMDNREFITQTAAPSQPTAADQRISHDFRVAMAGRAEQGVVHRDARTRAKLFRNLDLGGTHFG